IGTRRNNRSRIAGLVRNSRDPMITSAPRLRRIMLVTLVRVASLVGGWILTTRFADWRQVIGYPLELVAAVPDALFVRYLVQPTSSAWLGAMVFSEVVSSCLLVLFWSRRGRQAPGRHQDGA